jgi:Ca2+-binding RTX toxin-like protein
LAATGGRWKDSIMTRKTNNRDQSHSVNFELMEQRRMMSATLTNGTLSVIGTGGSDQITVTDDGAGHTVVRVNAATNTFNTAAINQITIDAQAGGDRVGLTGNKPATVIGGSGDDELLGGAGVETFFAGDGNDTVIGDAGNDIAFLGAGNDTFGWDPGDGSDKVEGQGGTDLLDFLGANVAEKIDISANGTRLKFFRDVGNITIDGNSLETVKFDALGGNDTITVNDLHATSVKTVNINLASILDGTTGDGAADVVNIKGTSGDDHITAASNGAGKVKVTGLAATVNVAELQSQAVTGDVINIDGLGGNDTIDAHGVAAGTVRKMVMSGSAGNDTITGSNGVDEMRGGDGNDSLEGKKGNDVKFGGNGNDTFEWDPGDGSDRLEGDAGKDTMEFDGSADPEIMELSANGARAKFTRNVGNIVMDLDNVERVEVNALGGNDKVSVKSISGTDVVENVFNGGDGNDTLIGGSRLDTLNGGNGNDSLVGGGGSDHLDGGAGNDTLNGNLADGSDDFAIDNVSGGAGNDSAVNGLLDVINLGADE